MKKLLNSQTLVLVTFRLQGRGASELKIHKNFKSFEHYSDKLFELFEHPKSKVGFSRNTSLGQYDRSSIIEHQVVYRTWCMKWTILNSLSRNHLIFSLENIFDKYRSHHDRHTGISHCFSA